MSRNRESSRKEQKETRLKKEWTKKRYLRIRVVFVSAVSDKFWCLKCRNAVLFAILTGRIAKDHFKCFSSVKTEVLKNRRRFQAQTQLRVAKKEVEPRWATPENI